MKMYRLFSRKTGWPNGNEVKYFATNVIEDDPRIMKMFINRSGKDILSIAKGKEIELKPSFIKLCKVYDAWYLYEADTVITDTGSD